MRDCIGLAQEVLGTGIKFERNVGEDRKEYLVTSDFLSGLHNLKVAPTPLVLPGSIDRLKASKMMRGPFNIELTESPFEHLTIQERRGKQTIRILKLDDILSLWYQIHRTGITR
jgi:hypothetical protein